MHDLRETMTSSALSEVQRLLDELVDALGRAKGEVPAYSIEAVTFLRAETKVIRRRVENMRKTLGDTAEPTTAA